jgi:nascent polypeptide-associated complex subunit beta
VNLAKQMETNASILAAREKLKAKFGTQLRCKKKPTASSQSNSDKKLQGYFKRMGAQPIPGIDEVNFFHADGNVTHFTNPKVSAVLPANTFIIQGSHETKPMTNYLPGIMQQLAPKHLNFLKKLMESQQGGSDEIPDLVEGENFEEISRK